MKIINKINLKIINYTIFIIFSIVGINYISYVAGKCSIQSKGLVCKAIKKSKIYNPFSYFFKTSRESKKFLKQIRDTGEFKTFPGRANNPSETKERFLEYKPGFEFYYKKGSRPDLGYLLLSKFPNNVKENTTELWDLNNQKMIRSYEEKKEIRDLRMIHKKDDKSTISKPFGHPLINKNGDLVFHRGRRLVMIDKCSNLLKYSPNKISKLAFHHALEKDVENNYYVPTFHFKYDKEKHSKGFINHGYAILDKNFEIKKQISFIEILRDNNLLNWYYGTELSPRDPFHINSIQSYKRSDGKRIVLISVRNLSSVFAVEVETNKIIWVLENAFSYQHDIDILNSDNDLIDISIFDNNVKRYSERKTEGNKVVKFYNLPTFPKDEIIYITSNKDHQKYKIEVLDFKFLEQELQPKTITEGLSDFNLENNSLMIEETNYGRLFEIDLTKNKLLWQFINKDKFDSVPYYMSWSRRIDKLPINFSNEDLKSCN